MSEAGAPYILEHQEHFPGVTVERVFLRQYPHHDDRRRTCSAPSARSPRSSSRTRATAAWTSATASASPASSTQYDRFLRGENGASRVQVDALGNARRGELGDVQPRAGPPAAAVARPRRAEGRPAGARRRTAGAFVVMDVHNGEVLGARLAALVRPERLLQGHQAVGLRRALRPETTARRSSNRAIQGALSRRAPPSS